MSDRVPQRVHLVGIGGVHMSAIAQILLAWGHQVSGSDLRPSPFAEQARDAGATVYYGHAAAQIGDAELVVITSAAPADNPEIVEARRRGIPVIKRAEMVAQIAAQRRAVCVAGSHGKTTTTSLIAWTLHQARLEPTYLIGGHSVDLGGNAAAGAGPYVVLEADEYDRAFLNYRPYIAVVTNIEPDHLDIYGDFDTLKDAFRQFLEQVTDDGLVVACIDSPAVRDLLARLPTRAAVQTYSLSDDRADWLAREITPHGEGGSSFIINFQKQPYTHIVIHLPGMHNVSNALAAVAVAHALAVPVPSLQQSLARFSGASRRFQLVGEAAGVTVMDDYGHHPTEITATLTTARARFAGRRLVCLFQPHTYSRSQYLLDGFRTCFTGVDRLLITDTYAAREEPSAGIDARQLASQITTPHAIYVGPLDAAGEAALAELQPGDVFFTIGAGDVDKAAYRVLEGLKQR